MKITKRQLRRIIKESVSFMRNGDRYTETERRPHRRPGANGKPMDFVIYSTLNPATGTPGGGSLAVPQGMSIEDFYAKGGTAGLSDFYGKPETGADMNRKIRAAEERGDWDSRSQNEESKIKITKDDLKKIIKESIMQEFFGPKKHSPEVYYQVFLDAGYTKRNIRSAIPNLANTLSARGINPDDVGAALQKLLQTPGDHIAGIPGGKSIYKELRKMGAIK